MGSTLFSVSSDSNGVFSSPFPSLVMEPTKQRGDFESGLFSKHGRSALGVEETDELNHLKVTKSDPMLIATRRMEPFHLWSNSCSLSSDGERMLSFSSPRSDAMAFSSCETLPCLWKAGMCHGRYNVGMHGTMGGFKGSFTPSQWMELEQQALIYKYIDAKIPVPSNLVIPIRTSLNPSGFPSFTAGSYRSGKWGYGSCNLAFAGNADPEPGRCRRTDGKKWRCSRDAVGDQKYCERHMNRGRHRSRKHVEGHNGHAAKAAMPTPSQLGPTASGSLSNHNLSGAHQQLCKSLQAGMAESSPTQFDRLLMIKGTSSELALNSQTASVQTNFCPEASDAFPIFKQQTFYEGTSVRPEASLSSSDSLFCVPKPEMHDDQPKPHPLLHFIDDWPKTHSEHPSMAWSDIEEMHTERTRLSISTPVGSSQHSSSSSSPNKHKLALSPISLPHDNRHPSWMPISWDPMLGGPLGEVLTNKSRIVENNSRHSSSSPLNLLTDGWDLSPRVESSPTGVLQKACFVSLSSSTASSPRTVRQKAHEADEFGSTFVNPYD